MRTGEKQKISINYKRAPNGSQFLAIFSFLVEDIASGNTNQISLDHLLDQGIKLDLTLPSELLVGLGRVAEQQLDLGGAVVSRVDTDTDGAILITSNLLLGSTLPGDGSTSGLEGLLDKLTDSVHLSGGEDKVISSLLLEHAPHTLDIVTGVTPITLGIQVSEVQALLLLEVDRRDSAGNLAGDEGAATARGLVVEEDTVAGIHVVGLTVVDGDPVGVHLGNTIGRAGVEGSGLALGDLSNLSVQLGGGSLKWR